MVVVFVVVVVVEPLVSVVLSDFDSEVPVVFEWDFEPKKPPATAPIPPPMAAPAIVPTPGNTQVPRAAPAAAPAPAAAEARLVVFPSVVDVDVPVVCVVASAILRERELEIPSLIDFPNEMLSCSEKDS